MASNVSNTTLYPHDEPWPLVENAFSGVGSITAWSLFYVLVIILTLADNALVIIAFLKFTSLRTLTNYLVVSLACNDIMVALVAVPLWIGYLIIPDVLKASIVFTMLFTSCDIFVSTASIINLACISIDRYICISSPYRYREIITRRRVIAAILMMRVLGILLCTPAYTLTDGFQEYQLSLCVISYFIPLCVIVVCYAAIFRIALSHQKRIAMNNPNPSVDGSSRRFSLTRELKAAKTLAVVIGAFLLSWSPFFIINFLMAIDSDKYSTFVYFHPEIIYFIKFMHYTNSCWNFFVYATMSRDFRTSFKRMLYSRCDNMEQSRTGMTLHEATNRLS